MTNLNGTVTTGCLSGWTARKWEGRWASTIIPSKDWSVQAYMYGDK